MNAPIDPVRRFLTDCTTRSLGNRVQSSVLHQVYKAWCLSNDVSPLSIRRFAAEMERAGCSKITSDVRWWIDLKLLSSKTPVEDPSAGVLALETAWQSASPLEALSFLQSKLKALGLQK
jgi:putative DNA primase/helicase